ncbi:ATP-binding protein [Thalassobius sp. S69A]|uniref:hybrid sensor histidine kinase/response regulator n=1 Tax=unclassified Thalassovita TaxID=2619711 RepID=UPI000C5A8629|nr:hybrid sensor histidine kinase/response regulator [Paracoccaceae bacterium]
MSFTAQSTPIARPQTGRGRVAILLALGLGAVLAGGIVAQRYVSLGLLAVGVGLLTASGLVLAVYLLRQRRQRARRQMAAEFLANDPSMCFTTDELGRIGFVNKPAQERLKPEEGSTLASVLQDILANPGTTLGRMQIRAEDTGGAVEELSTRRGHIRLAATALGQNSFAWRIEEIHDTRSRLGNATHLPMLTAGRSGAILSMNEAARNFVGSRVRNLEDVFSELPLQSGRIVPVRHNDATYPCFIVESQASTGKREVFFLPTNGSETREDAEWAAFNGLPVAVLLLGSGGEIVQSNRLARDLLGLSSTDGITLPKVFEGLGRPISDWLEDARRGRGLGKSEFLRLKSSDKELFLQVSLGQVEDRAGASLIAILHDATELKSLEAQFVQSQKMQAIGELAGGVAHDFNNLLTAISGHCDLLMLRHDQGDSDYADLVQITQNANRAAALVGQLLAFSRKQTLRPEVLDLRETLADLTHLLNRLVGEKISLTLIHDPVLKPIRADKRQLEQVLMNLVVNARDAMSNGGEIRIETGSQRLDAPLARDRAVVPPGEYVTVRVSDEGCGIPSDKLQKVFEPFFTTKRTGEGTGLGLSTAYGIVKQSGGYIFVDSVYGQGTDFSLMFPAHVLTEEEAAPRAEAQEPAQPQNMKREEGVVLLVEDEAPVRAFASRALKMRGYTVVEAGTGEEALDLLSDPSLQVDLFVSDVIMPGMDGPSWVRQARENRPDIRVVFVSGYAEDALDESTDPVGNSVFLPKPFSLNDLLETVQTQLA